MADVIYNYPKSELLKANIDLVSDTIKVALCTSSYTPDQDTHENFDDITNEVVGTGYTADGATLANKAVTKDNTDNEGVFDADDVVWTTSTITARYAIIYKDSGTDSTSPLLACVDFGTDKVSTAGTFTIQWATEGILNLT